MRQTLLVRAVVCSLVVFAAACRKPPTEPDPNQPAAEAPLSIRTFPVRNALVGEAFMYSPELTKPGAASWQLVAGPSEAVLENGQLRWTPQASGNTTFALRAELNGQIAEQSFTVAVAGKTQQAFASIDPANPNGAQLSVDAPLSPIRGTAVKIAPGALPSGAAVTLTISSLDNPPVPLGAAQLGLGSNDLRVVELGPSGTVFQKPVTVYLPVSDAVLALGTPEVHTFDYATGRWEPVQVLAVDAENKLVVASVQHFSTYAALPPSPTFQLNVSTGGAACPESLFVSAPLAKSFAQLPAQSVNGYSGAGQSVADVLSGLAAGQALQVLTRIHAATSSSSQDGWQLLSASRLEDGSFRVEASNASAPSGYLSTPQNAGLDEVEAWLNGSRSQLVLGGLGASLSSGATLDAEGYLSVVPASDAQRAPAQLTNPLGADRWVASSLTALEGFDADCDGAPDAYDPNPNGDVPPVLSSATLSPLRVLVGASVQLAVSVSPSDATVSWASSDPSVALNASGVSGSATPSVRGSFRVTVTASKGSAQSSYTWDLLAEEPAASNTAPTVFIAAATPTVRAGEALPLMAIARDAEQPVFALSYQWTAGPGLLSGAQGPYAKFLSAVPGDYTVRCIVNDGQSDSAPATITISVLPADTNRPPEAPLVTPLSATLEHASGATVTLVTTAASLDPDGDAVSYHFIASPSTPLSFTLVRDGGKATFSSSANGQYVFFVYAQDAKGAQSPWVEQRILVMDALSGSAVDADGDSYPSGADCDDAQRSVHPGAAEVCADGVDQDCDGKDLSANDCDADGDRFTISNGDCDDADPAKSPGAAERCDGVDNDCDSTVDESFGVGSQCSSGVGGCASTGSLVCNATRTGAVCNATPSAPQTEVCGDRIDNDCNGAVDDVSGGSSGDVSNCGGCNLACASAPNSSPACVNGGCQLVCAEGFRNTNGAASDGCECALSNQGTETCDGLDNDCDGVIDENTAQTFYGGPAGTEGVGVCSAGFKECNGGALATVRREITPSAESCNGQDDDCDGKVDEDFTLSIDVNNCGACGKACASGQSCSNGICTGDGADGGTVDPPDAGVCGAASCNGCCSNGVCLSGMTSSNCGKGGNQCFACASGAVCQAGSCTASSTDGGGPTCGNSGSACGSDFECCSGSCQGGVCASTQSCPAGMLQCAVGCVDPLKDSSNCGGCGIDCGGAATCVNGVCEPGGGGSDAGASSDGGAVACPPGYVSCGGMCVNTSFDGRNCGGCGIICEPGFECQSGVCSASVSDGGAVFDAGGPTCGASGSMCASGPECCSGSCVGGVCQSTQSCPAGMLQCAVGCVDPMFDSSNCGGCGTACGAGMSCVNGSCESASESDGGAAMDAGGPTCPFGSVLCGGMCVNTSFDGRNCGGCGIICEPGFECQSGVCSLSTSDGGASTCGASGSACAVGAECCSGNCQGGVCQSTQSCPAGMLQCAVGCVDPMFDSSNCGGCGIACGAGMSCVNGSCESASESDGGAAMDAGGPTCPFGSVLCGGMCVNTSFDGRNCGGCGIICEPGFECQSGVCSLSTSDGGASTCGASGSACAVGAECCSGNCTGGVCQTSCPPTMIDCGGQCIDPNSDPNNCGACGNVCGAGMTCTSGTCVSGPSCPGGMIECASGCIDPTRDPANCGGCGITCEVGFTCIASQCQLQ